MSYSTIKIAGAKEDLIVSIPAVGEAVGANATPEITLTAAIADSVPHKLYGAVVNCEDNPNEDVTLRLWDTVGTPTVGTDDAAGRAHVWVPGKRGRKTEYEWPMGIRFPTGIAAAVVKGDGGTGGSDNPSGTVRVTLRIKQSAV
jgi:hypothetical protein